MSDTPQTPPQRSPLGLFGMMALIGSALVAFNTLIVSCSADRAARNAAQLDRIEQREHFWTEAMRDLGELLRSKEESEIWETRCALLAARTAPFVESEVRQSTRAKDGEIETTPDLLALERRVFDLQRAFVSQISAETIVGADCAKIYAEKRAEEADLPRAAEQTAERAGIDATGDLGNAIVARQDLIELTGESATGWDIDVFWCERANAADSDRNFQAALTLGRELAGFAEDGGTLEGYLLGRIRVRMLATSLQNLPAYRENARSRRYIIDKDFADEEGLGRAIGRLGGLKRQPGGLATRWYVSAFYCGAGLPPA